MTDELVTGDRDPRERKTLEDALRIALNIVDNPSVENYTLAAGFLVLCGDMAAMLDAAKKSTHFCGWCERANGDSRLGLIAMPIDEIREHTVRCEHNPLVVETAKLRAEVEAMRMIGADAGRTCRGAIHVEVGGYDDRCVCGRMRIR